MSGGREDQGDQPRPNRPRFEPQPHGGDKEHAGYRDLQCRQRDHAVAVTAGHGVAHRGANQGGGGDDEDEFHAGLLGREADFADRFGHHLDVGEGGHGNQVDVPFLVLKTDHPVVAFGDLGGDVFFQLGRFFVGLEAQFAGCVRNADTNLHGSSVRQSVLGFSLKAMAQPTDPMAEAVTAGLTQPLVVLGAPGSGKTTLLRQRVGHLVSQGVHPDHIRFLTPTRAQATALRDEVGLALGHPTQGSIVQSVAAMCFSLLRTDRESRGLEPPTLRSGADVDQDIRSVLAEQLASPAGPQWPEHLNPAVRSTEAFRTELRELIARLTEWGLDSPWLRENSAAHPAWPAVADFLDDYQRVVARARPDQFDAAELLRVATTLIADGAVSPQGLQAVVIDDFQDLSPAAGDFVAALHRSGIHVTLCADPDVAGQTFRGADPEGPVRAAELLGVTPVVLPTVHRHGSSLRQAVATVSARIGTARAGQQRQAISTATGDDAEVVSVVAPSAGREANDIARLLLQRHRDDAVAFSDMVVATRRASQIPLLAARLQQAGVPTQVDYRVGLSEHPASRELVGWILAARQPGWLTAERATTLLEGVYGQFEPRRLRRLEGFVRALDRREGTTRRGIDAVIEILTSGDYPPEIPVSFHRPLERVMSVLRTLRELPAGSSAVLVASTAWQAWGVEKQWAARAADPERPSLFHREALQQVSALLATADRYAERHPGVSPEAFFAGVLDNAITEDVVLPVSERTGVFIATASSLTGVECDTVVLHGINDHVWPNTRIRWSLLGAPLVARVMRGQLGDDIDDRRVVIDDELRMAALALSRAKHRAIVTSVHSDDTEPSPLFRLLAEGSTRVHSEPGQLGSSRERVASYRAALTGAREPIDHADAALAVLADRGVGGAHPSQWWGLSAATSDAPLFENADIPLSPSTLGSLEVSPVDWLLDRIAPDEPTSALGIGSLVHHALEHEPWGDEHTLISLVESRWSELDFDSAWVSQAQLAGARRMVSALSAYLVDRQSDGVEVVGVEQGFALRIDNVVLRGLVDRIERETDGSLVVVDLKTGRAVTNAEEIAAHPQLQAYQYALADPETRTAWNIQGGSGGAWLLYVSQGVRGKPYRISAQDALDDEGLEAFAQRVRDAAQVAASAQFSGPRHYPMGGATVSRHRWQRVGSVCGD